MSPGTEERLIFHPTRAGFMRATGRAEVRCLFCPSGFADAPDHAGGCPRRERLSTAEARAGLRAREAKRQQVARERVFGPPQDAVISEEPRHRYNPELAELFDDPALDYPPLATDAEIRRATRTGREQ